MMTEAESQITWEDVMDTAVIAFRDAGITGDEFSPTELDNLTDRQKQLILNETNRVVLYSRWKDLTFDGRRYYSAHKAILLYTPSAGQGTTSNESVGSVSVSMTMPVNNPSAEQGILETHLGRQYDQLLRRVTNRIQKVRIY